MIIVYRKDTGEIIMSIPEAFGTPPEIGMGKYVSTGDPIKDMEMIKKTTPNKIETDYAYLMPLEAYDFENPNNPKNIHEYKAVLNSKKKLLYLRHPKTREKIQHVDKKDVRELAGLWDDTYFALKGLHPGMRVLDALEKEGMKFK
jgi:hypothetical protein